MWAEINLEEELTIGKLRKLVNNELSKFPDDTPINMCIELCQNNVDDKDEQPCAPILSILSDKESINFYNYI